MNDELTKKLIEYLDAGANLVVAQAPELIQQAFWWWAAVHAGWLLVCGAGTYVAYRAGRYSYARFNASDDDAYMFLAFGCAILGIVCFLVAVDNGVSLLQLWMAPKVYMLEWLRGAAR